jgi:general secretion pathway protein K
MTMRNTHDAPHQTPSDGFILIAVLGILAALATLASIFSIYLANTAVFLSLNDNTIQSEALVFASLELTAYEVSAPKPAANLPGAPPRGDANSPPPPTHGNFNFRLGRAIVAVNFISEAARIDLNFATSQVVANFFAVLGAQRQEAEQYAERIDGWTTRPRAQSTFVAAQDNEEALYRAAGRNYSPRGAPFAHTDELSLVIGLPPALIERAKPFLTVYSGKSQIDVLDAAPEVLAAIPGMTPNLLSALAEARRTAADPQSISGALNALQGVATVEGGDTYRVQVHIRYDNGRQEASEVVILTGLTDKPSGLTDKPYRVLYWRDGVDVSSDLAQPPPRPR